MPVTVHETYRPVLEALLPQAERKCIDIGVKSIEDVHVVNDMDLLILVRNLVDTTSAIPLPARAWT